MEDGRREAAPYEGQAALRRADAEQCPNRQHHARPKHREPWAANEASAIADDITDGISSALFK